MKQKLLIALMTLFGILLPSVIGANNMILQQVEEKTLVSEDWDGTSATETWYNDLVVWEIDWVETYSDGSTVRKTFQHSDERSLKVLSDWVIKEEEYTKKMEFTTTAPIVSETVSSWSDQIKTVDGAKFQWKRDIREFSTEVTYDNKKEYNRYKAIDPSNCRVTYKDKVYMFNHHQPVSAVNTSSANGGTSSVYKCKGSSYYATSYLSKLSYTVGENTKDVYAFGTGLHIGGEATFFPASWGEINEAYQTKVLNESGKGYVYVWSLHFSKGYIVPVIIRPGSTIPEWDFEFVLKTDNNSYNSAVWNAKNNRWDNAVVGTGSNTDRYDLKIENGFLSATDTYSGLFMGKWSSRLDGIYEGFDMTIFCGSGGAVEYNGNKVSYELSTFTKGKTFSVNTSIPMPVTIYIKPEAGYRLKSVTRGTGDLNHNIYTNSYNFGDGADAGGYLDDDKLAFQNVCSNIGLYFQFEKLISASKTTFDYLHEGVWYRVNFPERTAFVLIADKKSITEANIQNLSLSGSTVLKWMELPEDNLVEVGNEIVRPTATYNFIVNSICNNAFNSCTKLTSVSIPNTVTTIEESAFYNCTNLTFIDIPNSTTFIGEYAFSGCKALTNVTIGNSVKSISKYTFSGCIGLKSIAIPFSVTCIDDNAFYGCESLSTLTLGESVETIGQEAFYNCKGLRTVNIPNKVKTIGDNAFYGCESLSTLTLGESVETIGQGVFYNCKGLKTVNIPNKVKTIGDNAFCGCESLSTLTLGESVETIGRGVFYNCTGLKTVSIPNKVKEIGDNAFGNCESIKTLTLGESVETIGISAFNYCTSLQSVIIPNSVKTIDAHAFAACYNLSSVTISKDSHLVSIGEAAFQECNSLKEIILPATLKIIGDEAFFLESAMTVYSFIESPFAIDAFGYDEANILYVPVGTKSKYMSTQGWGDAFGTIIEEGTASDNVTLTAKSYTRAYGDANPTFEYTVTGGTITSGTPTITCTATATSPVGTYDIVISKGTVSNSTVNLVKGTLTITKAPLTISAGNYTKKEGEDNPSFKATYSGFKNSETEAVLTKKPTITTTATKTSPAGSYPVTVSGADAQNYTIAYQNGTLTITEKSTGDNPLQVGDTFTTNGMSFIVTSISPNEVQVGDNTLPAIDMNTEGAVIIPSTVKDPYRGSYSVTSIGSSAFSQCKKMTEINIPEGVTTISDAFFQCTSLTRVNIPSSVTYIGAAFNQCSALAEVHITDLKAWCGIEFMNNSTANPLVIAQHLYLNGKEVKELVIPEGTTKIGKFAFYKCNSLTSVNIPAGVTDFEERVFDSCEGLTSVTSASNLPSQTFRLCKNLTNVTLFEGVTNIGERAFRQSGLTIITIPSSLKSVESNAFSECTSLTEVHIKDVASWCAIEFGDYPLNYAHHLFMNGKEVKELVIPEGVSEIKKGVFMGCTGLSSVNIPSSVTTIGTSAFDGCTGLEEVHSEITEPFSIQTSTFSSETYTKPLYVPYGTKAKYEATSGWKNFKNIVEMNNTGFNRVLLGDKTYDVYNMQGRKVRHESTLLDGLPKGVYIINGRKVMK